jgi:hypothetical protein
MAGLGQDEKNQILVDLRISIAACCLAWFLVEFAVEKADLLSL